MKDFWEKCDTDFAHITTGKYQSHEDMVNVWYDEFLCDYDFKKKTVIDYGCGGAWLFDELPKSIKKYYGFDIAERQIKAASERVNNKKAEILLLPQDLRTFNADALVCQSVIQHLSKDEYIRLMEIFNQSGIPTLILNWREGETVFRDDNVQMACHTNMMDIIGRLSNYTVKKINPTRKHNMKYGTFVMQEVKP